MAERSKRIAVYDAEKIKLLLLQTAGQQLTTDETAYVVRIRLFYFPQKEEDNPR